MWTQLRAMEHKETQTALAVMVEVEDMVNMGVQTDVQMDRQASSSDVPQHDFQQVASQVLGKKLPAWPSAVVKPKTKFMGISSWDPLSQHMASTWAVFLQCKKLGPCEALNIVASAFRVYAASHKEVPDFWPHAVRYAAAAILLATDWEFDSDSAVTREERAEFLAQLKVSGVKAATSDLINALGSSGS